MSGEVLVSNVLVWCSICSNLGDVGAGGGFAGCEAYVTRLEGEWHEPAGQADSNAVVRAAVHDRRLW